MSTEIRTRQGRLPSPLPLITVLEAGTGAIRQEKLGSAPRAENQKAKGFADDVTGSALETGEKAQN